MNRRALAPLLLALLAACAADPQDESPAPAQPNPPAAEPRPNPALRPESGKHLEERDEYWFRQRAFPAGNIPEGAYQKAQERWLDLTQITFSQSPSPMAPPAPRGLPDSALWSFLGPAPLDTTHGPYETPNMSPTAGRASAIAIDPTNAQIIYLGYAMGGVWKSTDGGASFTPLMDAEPSLSIGALAIDPASPSTLYVGTGEPALYAGYVGRGLYRSTDAGKSFVKIGGNQFDGLSISRVVLDGADIYVTTAFGIEGRGSYCTNAYYDAPGQGLYKSTDGGQSFKLLKAGRMVDLEIDTSVSPRRIFVSDYSSSAYRSIDGGLSWDPPVGLPTAQSSPRARRIEIAIAPSNPSIVYAGLGLGASSTVYRSTDYGATFAPISGAPDYCQTQCHYDNSVLVDPNDPATLYLGGSLCGVYKSQNATDPTPIFTNVSLPNEDCGQGSANWYLGYVHPDVQAMAFEPNNPSVVYAATDGGLARSKDSGKSWERVNNGAGTIQFYALCTDPNSQDAVYGGAQDNGTMRNMGNALLWRGVTSGDGGPCVVDPEDGKRVLLSTEGASLWLTTTGFAFPPTNVFITHEAYCKTGEPGCGDRSAFIAPLAGDPSKPKTYYVGTYRLYGSEEGGEYGSWKAISDDLTAGTASTQCATQSFQPVDDVLSAIAVAPSDPKSIYTGSQAGWLYRTTDGGASWVKISKAPLPSRWVSAIAVDPADAKRVYVAFSGFDATTPTAKGHVFGSSNGGDSWELRDIGVDVPVNTLIAHPVGPGLLYAGTDLGVVMSADGGKSWGNLGSNLPNVAVFSLSFQTASSRLVAGTHGRSAWSATFPSGDISASPASLSFTVAEDKGDPAAQVITVKSTEALGGTTGFVVSSDAPWLSASPAKGATAGAEGMPISVKVTNQAMGEYDGTVTITPSNGGAAITVPVHLWVTPSPIVRLKSGAPEESGCGCHAAGSEGSTGFWALIPSLVFLARVRRRLRKGER